MKFFTLIIPIIFLASFLFAVVKKVRVYDSFTEGGQGRASARHVRLSLYRRRHDADKAVRGERIGSEAREIDRAALSRSGHSPRDRGTRPHQAAVRQRFHRRTFRHPHPLRTGQLCRALRLRRLRVLGNRLLHRRRLFFAGKTEKIYGRADYFPPFLLRVRRPLLFPLQNSMNFRF